MPQQTAGCRVGLPVSRMAPMHDEGRAQLRSGVACSDGEGVVQFLIGKPWPEQALQLIGDALQVALRQEVTEAPGLAGECIVALRARGWEGDEELADSLESGLGTAPSRLLRPLAVDLEELATVLEGDPIYGGGRIDLQTGEVWPEPAIEYAEEIGEENAAEADDPDRWLRVDCEGSRPGYRDMEWFVADIDNPEIASMWRPGRAG